MIAPGTELAGSAAVNVAAVAAAASSLSSGPSMNRLMSLAASNSLAGSTDSMARGMSTSGNPAASSDGSGDAAKQEAVLQIRAALAALAQLNEAAYEAQHLLGMVPAEGQAGEQQQGAGMEAVPEGGFEDAQALNPGWQQQEGLNNSGAAAMPFQQFAAWSGSASVGSRSGRRSSAGVSGEFDGRPSSFTFSGAAMGPVASSHMRRVSVDGGGSGGGAAARAAAGRGRVSVDLGAMGGNAEARMRQMCPNLVKCEREQLAAIARREQQQQQQ